MSDNTGQNQYKADRPALRHIRARCVLLPPQNNPMSNARSSARQQETRFMRDLKSEETNPMLRSLPCPHPAVPQPLAATAISPTLKLKFAIFQRWPTCAAYGFIFDSPDLCADLNRTPPRVPLQRDGGWEFPIMLQFEPATPTKFPTRWVGYKTTKLRELPLPHSKMMPLQHCPSPFGRGVRGEGRAPYSHSIVAGGLEEIS
jgi:hypothetical protein